MSNVKYYIERVLAIIAAIILIQTLYFKFTGHEDSVYIFTLMGAEPEGRIVLGVLELIAALLLLYGRTAVFGAITGASVMFGAILSHIFILGIEVKEDGGTLFILALVTFACCFYVVFVRNDQLYWALRKIIGRY